MKSNVINMVKKHDISAVIFDIDGTLKDLVTEHTIALKKALAIYPKKRKRIKLVLFINKVGMYVFKTGVTPTNKKKQHVLIKLFSFLLRVPYNELVTNYCSEYGKLNIFFESIDILDDLENITEVFFATINPQNVGLNRMNMFKKRVNYDATNKKVSIYIDILKSNNLAPSKVLIVGDNFCDDIIPAKILKAHALYVNMYNTKLKKFITKMLRCKQI